MNPPTLIEEGFAGEAYLARVTDLLVRARAEDPTGGPWDAADLQWWSRSGQYEDARRLRFWSRPGAKPGVCALFPTVGDTIVLTCLWTKSSRDLALAWVLPELLPKVQAAAREAHLGIATEPLVDDIEWRQLLERAGFERVAGGSVQGTRRTSGATDLPWVSAGLSLRDDGQRAHDEPHPLAKRCGPGIHQRLLGQSLYRPDLDLSVRATGGEVIAYCLCWADRANGFAMLEPMRTETAWQARGLGTALIAEQARRLQALGIGDLKVNYAVDNPAAERLYARSGFVVRFERAAYRWGPAT